MNKQYEDGEWQMEDGGSNPPPPSILHPLSSLFLPPSSLSRSGFTLIEMLLATVLAGLLMGGVLFMATAVGRDRARIALDENAPRGTGIAAQFRWDLTNAMTMASFGNGRGLTDREET